MDFNNPQLKDPKYIKMFFILMAFIACLQCYARADYNLALFAFAFILWEIKDNDDSQKIRLQYMFIFSWIMDLVWVIYWGVYWGRDFFDKKWSKGVQNYVIVLASINLFLKLLAIIYIPLTIPNVKNALSIDGFINNVKSLLPGGSSAQQQLQVGSGANQSGMVQQGVGNYYQPQQQYYQKNY